MVAHHSTVRYLLSRTKRCDEANDIISIQTLVSWNYSSALCLAWAFPYSCQFTLGSYITTPLNFYSSRLVLLWHRTKREPMTKIWFEVVCLGILWLLWLGGAAAASVRIQLTPLPTR
jgi:hypothetical protein